MFADPGNQGEQPMTDKAKRGKPAKAPALDDLPRAAQDLDREDAAIHREGVGDQKPGVKPVRETQQRKPVPDGA